MTRTNTPGFGAETGAGFGAETVDMGTALAWAPVPSPVLTASGCSAFGQEL